MNESQKCPGYDRVLERNMGDGTASYHFDCPEEKRKQGCYPGGGKGYPEHWDMKCPTCGKDGSDYNRQPMTPNEYQELCARTLIAKPEVPLSPEESMVLWTAFGIAGESGEIVDYLKKGIFHRHGYDASKVEEELGDLLWYVAGLATKLGLSMESIMERNIDKLKQRYPDGYSSEASINRLEGD